MCCFLSTSTQSKAQEILRGYGQGIAMVGTQGRLIAIAGRNRRAVTIRSRTICRRHTLLAIGHYEGDSERDPATARLLDPPMRNLALGASRAPSRRQDDIESERKQQNAADTACHVFRRLCEGQTVKQLDSEPRDQHPRRYQLNDAINAEGERVTDRAAIPDPMATTPSMGREFEGLCV